MYVALFLFASLKDASKSSHASISEESASASRPFLGNSQQCIDEATIRIYTVACLLQLATHTVRMFAARDLRPRAQLPQDPGVLEGPGTRFDDGDIENVTSYIYIAISTRRRKMAGRSSGPMAR